MYSSIHTSHNVSLICPIVLWGKWDRKDSPCHTSWGMPCQSFNQQMHSPTTQCWHNTSTWHPHQVHIVSISSCLLNKHVMGPCATKTNVPTTPTTIPFLQTHWQKLPQMNTQVFERLPNAQGWVKSWMICNISWVLHEADTKHDTQGSSKGPTQFMADCLC